MEINDAAEWKYKAEGNQHIVVCNGKGKCLRLLKLKSQPLGNFIEIEESIDDYADISSSHFNNNAIIESKTDDLKFLECVVLPLMEYCDACHLPKIIKISGLFLRDLDRQIRSDRPKHRKHKSLHYNVPGLLMQDHCYIPLTACHKTLLQTDAVLNPDIITIEIKLKKGFMRSLHALSSSNSNNLSLPICQFCQTQIYRVLVEHRYKNCSYYCPLDLFSGDKTRMKYALSSLLFAPQNNLRFFKNGSLIFSQEILDTLLNNDNNNSVTDMISAYLKTSLHSVLKSDINNGNEIEMIIDLLCQSLLLPIVPETNYNAIFEQHCHGQHYKEHLCNQKRKSFSFMKGSEKSCSFLPETCILSLILQQQRLDKFSISEIYKKYQELELHLITNPKSTDKLGVDGPYNSPGWCKLSKLKEDNKSCFEGSGTMSGTAHHLRQFLVAKSFNDCSIMITFQKISKISTRDVQFIKKLVKTERPSAHFNVVQDLEGCYHIASIALVDTDPKSSTRIPDYYKKSSEISEWWKKVNDVWPDCVSET